MTNSSKIILAFGTVCAVSLVATWNLISREKSDASLSKTPMAKVRQVESNEAKAVSRINSSDVQTPGVHANSTDSSSTTTSQKTGGPSDIKTESAASNSTQVLNDTASIPVSNQTKTSVGMTNTVGAAQGPSDNKSSDVKQAGSPNQATTAVSDRPSESKVEAPTKNVKAKTSFPGIDQREGRVMVRGVKHRPGQGEDFITVNLTVTDDSGEVSGLVWVIGEYIQRGTTGIMFMPSHNELNLSADGKPQNLKTGLTFAMKHNTDKKFIIRRPGFEGEELIAIRVGVVDKKTGTLHMARIMVKQSSKQTGFQRAKVELP